MLFAVRRAHFDPLVAVVPTAAVEFVNFHRLRLRGARS